MTQPFESHATALLNLLRASSRAEGDGFGMFAYVSAQSHSRMLQNFQLGSDSKRFIDCLLELGPETMRVSERPFPLPQRTDTPLGKRDIAFITQLAQPITDHFLKLRELHPSIPAILKTVELYNTNPGADLPAFYTADMCEEFHHLLCHLLRRFEAALLALHDFQDCPRAELQSKAFDIAVYDVATCGLTLWSLVYSSFLEEHLWRIQAPNPLVQARPVDLKSPEDAKLISEGSEWQPWWFSGRDSGSLAVRAAYTDCLRSPVAHFEAADDLISSASRFRDGRVSIKVVVSEDCGAEMRPWREVIVELVGQNHSSKCNAQEVISVIEAKVATNATLASRLDGNTQLGGFFRGTLHSKVCLASLIDASDKLETNKSIEYAISDVSQRKLMHRSDALQYRTHAVL